MGNVISPAFDHRDLALKCLMFVKKIVGEFARKVFDVRAGINPVSGSVSINNLDLRVHSTL